ncbi:MAG: hypothetical protein ACXVZJ_06440 [Terriglobales bacterium]
MAMSRPLLIAVAALCLCFPALAQDNYEIQVYAADTVEPGATMVEFHTNFTPIGQSSQQGLRPTNHALHETIEITHGWTNWMETGFYIFTYAHSGYGWEYVGSHIRPRVRVPESWRWPVGVSLSTEFGWQRRIISMDTWTIEIRPIVDKKIGPWYLAFNPTIGKSLVGVNANKGFDFSPNVKFSYDLNRKVAVGLEYYGSLGPIGNSDPLAEQQQQIFPTVDLNLSPNWEFNGGAGVGTTRSTDRLILKMIIGYRFMKKK